jgi:hypothetical protein
MSANLTPSTYYTGNFAYVSSLGNGAVGTAAFQDIDDHADDGVKGDKKINVANVQQLDQLLHNDTSGNVDTNFLAKLDAALKSMQDAAGKTKDPNSFTVDENTFKGYFA